MDRTKSINSSTMVIVWSPLSLNTPTNRQPSIHKRKVPRLYMSLSWCYPYFCVVVLLLLLLPSMTVKGAVLCSRCKTKSFALIFPKWLCPFNLPPPPETDKDICYTKECVPEDMDREYVYCDFETVDAENILCTCVANQPPECPAGQQTAAYRCDETLYVCWNLVPPQVLDLWDDNGNDCPLTQSPIKDLVYCDRGDFIAYSFPVVGLTEEDLCGNWCRTAASNTTCPNGKAIDERFHITAPTTRGNGAWPAWRGIADGDIGFCDYGGEFITDGWTVDRPVDFTCPEDISLLFVNDPGTCQAVVNYTEPECKIAYKLIDGYESGAVLNVSHDPYTIVFDNANQRCSFTVKVIDVEPPTVKCPSDIQVTATGRHCFSEVTYNSSVIATDNCNNNNSSTSPFTDGVQVVTGFGSPTSGSIFPAGVTVVELESTDSSGNTGRCPFQAQVTTNPSVNCSKVPLLTCPPNIVVGNDQGKCGAVVEYSVVTSRQSDLTTVKKATIKPIREKGLRSGSFFPIGTTEQFFTASLGPQQGIVACRFTITVVVEEEENESTTIEIGEGDGVGRKKCSTTRTKKTNDIEKTTSTSSGGGVRSRDVM
jgi:hypothetical protein